MSERIEIHPDVCQIQDHRHRKYAEESGDGHFPFGQFFFLPVFSTAATKFLSSHEFLKDRSIGFCPGKIA